MLDGFCFDLTFIIVFIYSSVFCLLANLAQTGVLWEEGTSTEKALLSNLPSESLLGIFLIWQLMWKSPAHQEQCHLWMVINGGIGKQAGQAIESKALSSILPWSLLQSLFPCSCLEFLPQSLMTWLHCMWLLLSCFLLTGCPSGS